MQLIVNLSLNNFGRRGVRGLWELFAISEHIDSMPSISVFPSFPKKVMISMTNFNYGNRYQFCAPELFLENKPRYHDLQIGLPHHIEQDPTFDGSRTAVFSAVHATPRATVYRIRC